MDNTTDLQLPSLPCDSSNGLCEPASYVSCGVCQHEIPWSVNVWREGSDYVAYFCGLECYARWHIGEFVSVELVRAMERS